MSENDRRPDRRQIARIPKGRRVAVGRQEYNHLVDMLNERGDALNRILADQRIQFERIAQIQAEIDRIKQVLARFVGSP
jgi:hypothetical protein